MKWYVKVYNPSGSNYDHYPPNEKLEAANITVLKLKWAARLMRDTKYLVRYDCCGAEGELTHKQINERVRHEHTLCLLCSQKKLKRANKRSPKPRTTLCADYGVMPPTWPVPQAIISLIRAKGWYAR